MRLCIVMVIFLLGSKYVNHVFGTKNFGPYEILFTKADTCHGPKTKDLTKFKCGTKGNKTIFSINITLPEVTKVETMRMTVFGLQNNVKKLMFTYRSNSPCTHFLLGPLLNTLLNTSKTDSCVINPGVYAADLDATAFSRNIYDSVIYGEYISKVVAYNKKGNIVCLMSQVKIVPVPKNK